MSKQTITVGCRVRTADGSEGTVRYIDAVSQTAEILLDEDRTSSVHEDLTVLPLAELRRITKERWPPIESLPDTRPHCPMCNKPLKPRTDHIREHGVTGKLMRRVFNGWDGYAIDGNDKFCTLSCAREFANLAFKAGYRITRKK